MRVGGQSDSSYSHTLWFLSSRLSSVTGFSVSVDGYCVKRVREYRYLGIIMDETYSLP